MPTTNPLQTSSATTRKISVIIPLEYHRGLALECIRNWAKHQDYPRDGYQILIGAPAEFDAWELSEIEKLLQPWDRIVHSRHDHDMTLIEEIAKLANSELLLFSESHCVPQGDALSYLIEVADTRPQWAAFSAPTLGMTHNLLSEIECDIYSQDIRGKLASHTWLRVLDQCFVIRRNLYEKVGGFRGEFGHFAEWLFAATMKIHNLNLGVAERAVVGHGYIGDYDDLASFTLDFSRGQIRYVDKCPDELPATLFPSIPELDDFKLRSPEERRRIFEYARKDSWQTLFLALRKPWHRQALLPIPRYLRWLAANQDLAGTNVEQLQAKARMQVDKSRRALKKAIAQGHRETAHIHFVEWFARLVKQGRYGYLAETYSKHSPTIKRAPDVFTSKGAWSADDTSHNLKIFNVHDAEGTPDGTIRWTLPTVQIFLPLQAGGNYSLAVSWTKVRPLNRLELIRVRLNGHPLPSASFQFSSTGLQLNTAIEQDGWQELSISIYPFQGTGDGRLLGLPLQAIRWHVTQPNL